MLPLIVALVTWTLSAEDEIVTSTEHGSCIMESLSAIRSQSTATNIYLEEIRNTLHSYNKRLDFVENRLKGLEKLTEDNMKNSKFIDEHIQKNEDKISNVQAAVEDVKAVLEANGEMTGTIMSRQMTMLSEVRLISLYKMTNQTGIHKGAGSDLAVDGQFTFSHGDDTGTDRTTTHTLYGYNQLWVNLGALFRIHKVVIWNFRQGVEERFIGTQIYADRRLLGVATSAKEIYSYPVEADDFVYARWVILKQTHESYLHVSEVQVWGTGPFSEDDRFA